MFILKHIVSLTSILWVAINLLIALALVLPTALIGWLIPLPSVSRTCSSLIDHIYRNAVKLDSFWMQSVVGIELVINGEPNTRQTPIVICNHQSWFDIPLIQEVITGQGPIVKFLIKREIVWVPIIGWVCLILNFPRLYRSQNRADRQSDYSIIQKASREHGHDSGALLIFPEGTRFTEKKRLGQQAPYQHLLAPRLGGLRIIKEHADQNAGLVDVTINYHKKNVRIWDCLHGDPRKITITLDYFELSEIENIETWLNQRWREKDQLLERTDEA